jgi:NAD(P)-dependent dehydrogenase (short-subunit alcohol dehydrogenase family)
VPAPVELAAHFAGRAVVVTGGGRGLGRGIATRFLEVGADVVICGRNEPDVLPASGARRASFVAADVRDADQSQALIDTCVARHGRVDVLVNNAGGAPPSDTAAVSPRFSTAIITLNLIAPLVLAQQANAVMQRQDEGGVIVNIASVSGLRPSPNSAAYGAAKAGLINLTQTLGVEFAPKVRVNCVSAGLIVTEQSHLYYGDDEGIAAVGRTVPLGHIGSLDEVADVVLFCASPLARYVTGANIVVHGGGERPAYLDAANPAAATGSPPV